MTIHLGIYKGHTGPLLLDAGARGARGVKASTNKHGFERLTGTVPLTLAEAWQLYDYGTVPWVRLRDNGYTIWEGRLADPELVTENGDGIALNAYGAWDALGDIPYTTLWSHSGTADWRPIQTTEIANVSPNRYRFDNNNRLYITLDKSSSYQSTTYAAYAYRLPDRGTQFAYEVDGTYVTNLPNTTWRIGVLWYSAAPGDAAWTQISSVAIASGTASGSFAQVLTGSPVAVALFLQYNSGTPTTPGGEADTYYARFSNVRVLARPAPVTAQHIIQDIAYQAYLANPTMIANNLAGIGAGLTLPDILEAVYEDDDMRRIIDSLIARGDSSGNLLEAAVWENRQVIMRQRGAAARSFVIDASSLRLRRPLDGMQNSVYATYKESDGFALRTATSNDAASIARFETTRRGYVDADTTSSSEAARQRDVVLTDKKLPSPAASYDMTQLRDGFGSLWPAYMLRAGDVLNVRGIPSGFGATVDRLRTVRVGRTDYDVDTDTMLFEPDVALPLLDVMLAQKG